MKAPTASLRTKVLLHAEQTGGAFSLIETSVPAGWGGPPLHHHDFDETFYVLAGELTFRLDDDLSTLGPGAFVFAPRGAHHTLANLSDADARYLLVCAPAGFERYFARLEAEEAGRRPPAWALRKIPETLHVGPPITQRDAAGA